jgi:tetratricopeptide (TPR) repeat protein
MEATQEDGLLRACKQLIDVGRADLAERELGRWLSMHPEDAYGHALMARALTLAGRGGEALAAADEAVRLAPDWAHSHFIRTVVLEDLDRHQESERSVREALALAPDYAVYHGMLSMSLLNQGWARSEEALHAAEQGLAVDPGDLACSRMRAEALLRLNRLDEAREAAAYALRLDPGSSTVHTAAGWIELNAGNPERTREHMLAALRSDPLNDTAEYGLGLAIDGPRFCAALAVQVEAWRGRLALAVWLFAQELVGLAALEMLDGILLGFSLAMLGFLTGAILWVRRRRPRVLAEMRIPGLLTPTERRDARWTVALVAGILLLLPVAVLLS